MSAPNVNSAKHVGHVGIGAEPEDRCAFINRSFGTASGSSPRPDAHVPYVPYVPYVLPAVRMFALLGCLVTGTELRAQGQPADTTDRVSGVLARVRRMTTGDVAGARGVVDSLVRALPDGEPMLAEALFARASIAASAAEAEQDYGRLVRLHPLSSRVPDALMRLAVLESARNDRASALRHLDRLLREHGDSPPRARASLLAARLRLDAGDMARGCEHLGAAYAAAGPTERDVQEQATQLGARCPVPPATLAGGAATPMGVVRGAPRRDSAIRVVPAPVPNASATRAARDSAARVQRVRQDSLARVATVTRDSLARVAAIARDSVARVAPPATREVTARFAVQFAAYATRDGAAGLAGRLRERGVPARVEGEVAPFRVRAGRYATRAEAEIAAQGWREGGQVAIVVPLAAAAPTGSAP